MTRSEFVAAGHTLTDGSLTWPVLTLDADAVVHNIGQLAAFTAERGLAFAPHGKTTMSPELFAAQLDAGAWGITVATGNQLLTAHSFGVRRLLVANEVLDPTVLRWIAQTLEPSRRPRSCSTSTPCRPSTPRRLPRARRTGTGAARGRARRRPVRGPHRRPGARGGGARGADAGRRAGRGQRLRGCARGRRRRASVPGRGARRRGDARRRRAATGPRGALRRRVRVLRRGRRRPRRAARGRGAQHDDPAVRRVSHARPRHLRGLDAVHAHRRSPVPRAADLGAGGLHAARSGSRSSAPASGTCRTTPACRWSCAGTGPARSPWPSSAGT